MPPESRATLARSVRADLPHRLGQGVADLGLVLDDPTLRRLLAYLDLLVKWNGVYNLTAIRDPQQMLAHHLLDALSILTPLRQRIDLAHATLADVGSGAGLPGIPLAIVEPGATILSIEPVGKKTAFQRQVCAELALTNVDVYTGRAEALTRPVDLVLCRAFASLATFVDVAAGLVGPDTLLAAMKGQRAEIETEIAALPPGLVATVEPLRVPFLDADRHLVFIGRAPAHAA
jgi:16S rRNA (guanine527-N7)-methyltransferase